MDTAHVQEDSRDIRAQWVGLVLEGQRVRGEEIKVPPELVEDAIEGKGRVIPDGR
jgi:hypothetical protein